MIEKATSTTSAFQLSEEVSDMLNTLYWSVENGDNLIWDRRRRLSQDDWLSIHSRLLAAVEILELNT